MWHSAVTHKQSSQQHFILSNKSHSTHALVKKYHPINYTATNRSNATPTSTSREVGIKNIHLRLQHINNFTSLISWEIRLSSFQSVESRKQEELGAFGTSVVRAQNRHTELAASGSNQLELEAWLLIIELVSPPFPSVVTRSKRHK